MSVEENIQFATAHLTAGPRDAHATGIVAVVGPTAVKRRALVQKNARQHRWISEASRQQREVVRWV
jgi:hypothetical protein